MPSILRPVVCCLSMSAACGVLAADPTPANSGTQTPLHAAAERPPLPQRPQVKRLDQRYAVSTVAYRRADGSLEIRSGEPLPAEAAQTEVQNDR